MKAQKWATFLRCSYSRGEGERSPIWVELSRFGCRLAMCAVAELPCHISQPSTPVGPPFSTAEVPAACVQAWRQVPEGDEQMVPRSDGPALYARPALALARS